MLPRTLTAWNCVAFHGMSVSGSLATATTAVPPGLPGSVLASVPVPAEVPAPLEQPLTSTSDAAATAARLRGADGTVGRAMRVIGGISWCLGDRRNPTTAYAVTEDSPGPVSSQRSPVSRTHPRG